MEKQFNDDEALPLGSITEEVVGLPPTSEEEILTEDDMVKAQKTMNNIASPEFKRPIFVGHADSDLLLAFEGLIDKNLFEIAILPPTIQKSMEETYYFSKLGEKERDSLLKVRKDQDSREKALSSIMEIEKMFKELFSTQGFEVKESQTITFKPHELKNLLNSKRDEKSSVKEVRTLLEFLQVHAFIAPTIINAPYHKQEYAITIDDATRLGILKRSADEVEGKIVELELLKAQLDKESVIISSRINREANEEIGEDSKEEDAVKIVSLTEKQIKILELLSYQKEPIAVTALSKEYNGKTGSVKTEDMEKLIARKLVEVDLDKKNKNVYSIVPGAEF